MIKLHIDIETYSSVSIKTSGAYKYIESPDFEILMVAYAFNDGPINIIDISNGADLPQEFTEAFGNTNVLLCAHNAVFERWSFNKYGLFSPPNRWECSMVKAAYCGLPLPLDKVSDALSLGDKGKLSTGRALIKYFCEPCKPTKVNGGRTRNLPHHNAEKWHEFKKYCINDVEAEREIGRILSRYTIPAWERYNYLIDQTINDTGVMIDRTFAENAQEINRVYTEGLIEELKQLTGLDNPNSLTQLKKWLSDVIGEEITSLTKDTVPELIEKAGAGPVKDVLRLRQKVSRTSNKKYTSMLNCISDEDERARGLFQFYGANRTGRWAGRLVQMQNLKQNHIKHLAEVRRIFADNDYDLAEMLFDDIADILSQLIRTAFIAKPGYTFAVADFSAIEARVIAWLAGEQWRLDVFNSHGKIYEASAAMMFNVPLESVTKGSDLRSKGKVAELALGYQGSVGAVRQMDNSGDLDHLTDGEVQSIVSQWREKSPAIVKLWQGLEHCAKKAIKTGQTITSKNKGLVFAYDGQALTITLPSGRKLFYWHATLSINKYGRESIKYRGTDQQTGQWTWVDTYGGKLAENCLAGNTKVLTLQGWRNLDTIKIEDKIWDGIAWVSHKGLLHKGERSTVTLEGVNLTPDHKILTNNGWKNASQSAGYIRAEVELPYGFRVHRIGRQKVDMVNKMRLRKKAEYGGLGVSKRQTKIMWMQKRGINRESPNYSRAIKPQCLRGVALYESKMYEPETQSLSQLRGPRYKSLPFLVKQFRGVRRGHVTDLFGGVGYRQDRQRRKLHPRELPLDNAKTEQPEPKGEHDNRYPRRPHDHRRSVRGIGYRGDDSLLQSAYQLSPFANIRQTGCKEQVYDLLDCGPLNRFTVLGDRGPFIVHNCTQAIARDLLTESMQRLSVQGYNMVLHVHDEVGCEVTLNNTESTPEDYLEKMCNIMGSPVSWAEGLPLKADGYLTTFYKKD